MKKSEIKKLNTVEKIEVKNLEVIPDNIELYFNYSIHENNKIIKQSKEKRANSFLKQFIQALDNQFTRYYGSVLDTSNTSRTWASIVTSAAITNDNYGIQVGTGSTAVTINDYKLETQIPHGSTSGKLQYGIMQYGIPAFTSTTGTLRFTRVFTNASGGTITVNEIGLASLAYISATNRYFLLMRDILSPGVPILNGQSMTLNYNMTTTI